MLESGASPRVQVGVADQVVPVCPRDRIVVNVLLDEHGFACAIELQVVSPLCFPGGDKNIRSESSGTVGRVTSRSHSYHRSYPSHTSASRGEGSPKGGYRREGADVDLISPLGRQPAGALHVLDWQSQKLSASAQAGCDLSAGAARVTMILSEGSFWWIIGRCSRPGRSDTWRSAFCARRSTHASFYS
jgi:hypothetical protein